MALTAGTQLGSYEITALLGKGGMGEVYRARDTKLKRDVAIKVLPEEFSRDVDRVARFQREAEVLASLNHPNIAAIYDLQEAQGSRYLVLELVEGETLADRIGRGPIPVEDALDIAKNICEALEAAHEKGIIHRDLKPANVKISPDGKVKVLDFGLAKAMSGAAPATTLSNSPTLMSGTMGGVIIGTAAYMSPEQARGREADQRSDVFAFGCVLYEMLTSKQAFQGEDVSDVLASVMKSEPDMNLLPAKLNQRLPELLVRCLAKNRRDRWQAAGDLRIEFEKLLSDPLGIVPIPRTAAKGRFWAIATPLVAAIVVGIAIGITVWNLKPSVHGLVTRFSVLLPGDQVLTTTARQSLAISPDGSRLVYVANGQLFLRSMGEMEARPVPGTSDSVAVGDPFFSPDGQWIGFWSGSDSALKKISITGGAAITISRVQNLRGASWDGDQIVFGDVDRGIMRVSANAGEPQILVNIKPEEGIAYGPQLLDRGRAVLFTLAATGTVQAVGWDRAQVVVQSLVSGQRRVVVPAGTDGRYVPSGHVIYAVGENIFAIPFDLKKLEPNGAPVPVIEGVKRASGTVAAAAAADVSFSGNGTLAYLIAGAQSTSRRTLALVDRNGKAQTLPLPAAPYRSPRMSPDGKKVAYETEDGNIVWVYAITGRAAPLRLTFDGQNHVPSWTPDGKYVIFQSARGRGQFLVGIYRQLADGTGPAEPLIKPEPDVRYVPWSLHPSGSVLAVLESRGLGGPISFLPLNGSSNVQRGPDDNSRNAAFSRDGRWVAYEERVGERSQIFVRPYPGLNAKYQIVEDGNFPVWSPDNKQLFFIRVPNKFFAVDIQTEPSFTFGKPSELPIAGSLIDFNGPLNYDITPDGRQFVVVMPASQTEANQPSTIQINVVLNWLEELKQRVPQIH